jgi:hypothetical protein
MNNALDPGEIRFVDNYKPQLGAGTYTIKVEQILEGQGAHSVKSSFFESQEFLVSAPRFRLDPADIQQIYPPPNSQGQFQHDLPHIVLNMRTLPWEQKLKTDDPDIPWMVLLLFLPSEILPPVVGTNKDSKEFNPTGTTTIEVKALLIPEEGVLTGFDDLESIKEPDQELSCQVIDIEPDTFNALIPKLQELKYLTHCREVKMDQKALPGQDLPGDQLTPGNGTAWYSVVVGGRFPSPRLEGEQTSQLYIAHLVSLEGLAEYIQSPEKIPDDIQRIRLISLTNWSFTRLPEIGENFRGLMLGLLKGGPLIYKLAYHRFDQEAGEFASRMLDAGYLPRGYHTRLGEKTFAWYRGPFTPQLAPRFPPDRGPFSSAAQAMIYDQVHGLFDLSYAVAWEIGQLLALSDKPFSMRMLNLRRKAHHQMDLLIERRGQSKTQGFHAADDKFQQFKALLEENLASDSAIGHLLGDFASEIEPLIFKPNDKRPSDARIESPVPANTFSSLADYHQRQDAQQFLKEIDSKELDQISEWLSHLYLLYGVPFNYLVPDESLLMPETIRFFYLDRNWLDVLLDGALSIGMHSSRDTFYQNQVYDVIIDAVHERTQTLRDRLLGKNTNEVAENSSEGPLAGLLIRSAVVSGWPGLEVRAYCRSDGVKGSGPIGLLRMERLAVDILLCIFNQVPEWIEFDEPKEGLHFGLENGEIGLRYVGKEMDKVGKLNEKVKLIIEHDDNQRLNISDLLSKLKEKKNALGLSEKEEIGPAAFALQMVRVPQQIVFKTTDKS